MRTTFLTSIFLSLFAPLFFFGCRKDDTINLDLTVIDAETGEPLVAGVSVHYDMTGAQDVAGEIYLGQTDSNGKLRVKKDIGDKRFQKLYIYGGKFYTHSMVFTVGWPSKSVEISSGSKKTLTVEVQPIYHYFAHIKNVNCFDATDSVWITTLNQPLNQSYSFAGCADETPILGGLSENISFSSYSNSISFHIKVKRNGQVTEYDETKQLTKGTITPISIEY